MTDLLPLILAGVGGAVVLGYFVLLEGNDRREVIFGIVLGVVVVESLLYPGQGGVPTGLFYPSLGGQPLRLPQVLIPLALLARGLVHGLPRRVTPTGLAWTAFFCWYAFAGYLGFLEGHPSEAVLFDAKSIIYVGGGLALAAGASPARLMQPQVVARWMGATLLTVIPLAWVSVSETEWALDLPLVPIPQFGYGADASSVVVFLAVVALVVEACRPRGRWLVAAACLVLVLSPVAGSQSAAVVQLAAVLGATAVAAAGSTWRRRIRATLPTEAALLLAGAASVVVLAMVVTLWKDERPPLAKNVERSFVAEAEGSSAKDRRQLWGESRILISERPWLGWGLGAQITVRSPGVVDPVATTSHNIVFDLLLRSGVVGLALFSLALALSLRGAWAAWREHPDPVLAALALGCAIAIVGLVAKGTVESILEKFRLATVFGLSLGVIAAIEASMGEGRSQPLEADLAETEMPTTRSIGAGSRPSS